MFISIIGSGKVGICIALYLDKIGHNVICYDINDDIIKSINHKEINSIEPYIKEYLKESNLLAFKFPTNIITSEIIIILVQTPSLENGSYDHSYVDNVIDNILKNGKSENEKIIIITCTVMPEYCNSIYKKLKDYNYKLIYNPLFIAQGSILYDIENHDMMLVGCLDDDNNIIENMYNLKNTKFCKMTLLEAEISKISLNCFKTTKISYANMIGDLAVKSECNPNVILNAIGLNTTVGNKCLKYGDGFGGPCFPRDNKALYYYGNQKDIDLLLCKTTEKLNDIHLIFQYEQLKKYKDLEFDYITYKEGIDILDESQRLKLAIMLHRNGNNIIVNENKNVINKLKILYPNYFIYKEKND